jgi:two-component system sensor histidine kinase HydH
VKKFLDEVLDYVGLDDADQSLLRELHPRLAPLFPEIARQLDDPDWAIEWMESGLLGPYDEAFVWKRARPARTMFRAINIVRTAYIEKAIELFPASGVGTVVRAVNKLLDLELAVMMRHRQLDSDDKRITAMQTLTSGLAHEIRNPLNAAALQLELLERRLRRLNDDPKLREPIELANHELSRLTALLNDFLQFARPPELNLVRQDVVNVVRHVIELEKPLAERRHVSVELVAHEPLMANVDAGKVHQIVQNLVRNAVEAASAHVEIAIENGRPDRMHIRVRDDGAGIPADLLPRIYEPFFSTKDFGTGMGMAIVHSLVAMHGGKIAIQTSPTGTLFDIELPR